jgi:hypothetical protein
MRIPVQPRSLNLMITPMLVGRRHLLTIARSLNLNMMMGDTLALVPSTGVVDVGHVIDVDDPIYEASAVATDSDHTINDAPLEPLPSTAHADCDDANVIILQGVQSAQRLRDATADYSPCRLRRLRRCRPQPMPIVDTTTDEHARADNEEYPPTTAVVDDTHTLDADDILAIDWDIIFVAESAPTMLVASTISTSGALADDATSTSQHVFDPPLVDADAARDVSGDARIAGNVDLADVVDNGRIYNDDAACGLLRRADRS